jgi:hypothetical protein
MKPSLLAMSVSGFLLAVVIAILCYDYYMNALKFDTYQRVMVPLVLSIAIGVHGLAHAYAEKNFNYNPLEGKWTY